MASTAQQLEGTRVTVNVLVPCGPANTNLLPQDTPFDRGALIQPDVRQRPVVCWLPEASDAVQGTCRLDIASKVVANVGLRPIAEHLDVPHTTVRAWWRRFQACSPTLLAHCTALAVTLDGTHVMLATNGERAALDALQVAWQRAQVRFSAAPYGGQLPCTFRSASANSCGWRVKPT